MKNGILVFLVFTLNCVAIDVRDFAPLSVGNTWRYKGFVLEDLLGNQTTDSIDVLIKLTEKTSSGDTIKYQFMISEKHFSRNKRPYSPNILVDTTIDKVVSQFEIHENLFGGGEWQASEYYQSPLFERHSYPDSLLNNLEVNGAMQTIFCRESFSERKKCFAKGLGPTYIYSNPYSGGRSTHKLEYYLMEFNGVKIEGQLLVGINSKREINQGLNTNSIPSSKYRNNWRYLFKNVFLDVLGRP